MTEHATHATTPRVGSSPKNRTTARFANAVPDFEGQCAAANRQGERCRRRAVSGRAVCDLHGGKTPGGIAHSQFRHGRNMRSVGRYTLGEALGLEYERFMADAEALVDGTEEIALTRVFIQGLLDEIAEAGCEDRAKWFEIYRIMDLTCRLRSVEIGRIRLLHEYATPAQMKAFLAALQQVAIEVCALAPTKGLEKEMRNTFARRVREVLALPIVGD